MSRFWVLFAVLLLSACVGGAGNSVPVMTYDFGLPVARLSASDAWPGLALEVRSPSWLDSTHVDYRLAYADSLTRRQYVASRWAGTPGSLVAQKLRQQLGAVSVTSNVATDCLLRVELQEFSQVFDAPQSSRGVLTASISLTDAKRRVVAERQVAVEKPASSADASGGVQALATAATEFGHLLSDWLLALENKGALKVCR